MLSAVIAHAGPGFDHGSEVALGAVAVAAMVIPLIVLAFIGRAFLRAAKNDEDARRRGQAR